MQSDTPFPSVDTVRQAVSNSAAACARLLQKRTIFVLMLMFCIGIGCMLWYVSRLQSHLIASIALQDASLYAQALTEFRTLYTSEVVETVRQHGIEVTHDYGNHAGAIPLPVTLTMLLGQRLSAHATGAQLRLYSPYPFPWRRQEGGLHDTFGQEAWDALQHHPTTPFYRVEDVHGRPSLRYAAADLMRPGCVACHNTHAASPRRDWHTGDVRGVLEVILPLDTAVVQTRVGLRGTFALMAVMAVLGLSGLALVIGRLRRSSAELAQRASTLEREITERQRVEDALRESEERYRHIINAAADAIISIDEHGLIREFNLAAERTFGFSKAELLGKPLTALMPARLRLVKDLEAELPSLHTDQDKLQQILMNLLSNAVKFTPKGTVTVTAQRHAGDITLAVADTGIGISQDALGLVFEEFRQVGNSMSQHYRGTGLGLSISRHLARLLGGEITVQSTVGVGSTFTVTLPLHSGAAPLTTPVPAAPEGSTTAAGHPCGHSRNGSLHVRNGCLETLNQA